MTLPPLKTEFEFVNQMYSKNSSYLKKQCIICHEPLERGKELVYCSKCRPFLLELEDEFRDIDLSEYPGLKLDSALVMLAVREMLPRVVDGHHWISLPTLYEALEENRYYQIVKKFRPAKRITNILTSELKRVGWIRSKSTGTYYRQEQPAAERVEA